MLVYVDKLDSIHMKLNNQRHLLQVFNLDVKIFLSILHTYRAHNHNHRKPRPSRCEAVALTISCQAVSMTSLYFLLLSHYFEYKHRSNEGVNYSPLGL